MTHSPEHNRKKEAAQQEAERHYKYANVEEMRGDSISHPKGEWADEDRDNFRMKRKDSSHNHNSPMKRVDETYDNDEPESRSA